MRDRSDDPSHRERTLYHGNTPRSLVLINSSSSVNTDELHVGLCLQQGRSLNFFSSSSLTSSNGTGSSMEVSVLVSSAEYSKDSLVHLYLWCRLLSAWWHAPIRPRLTWWSKSWMSGECRRRKEVNVLFNDALNTFYLRLYGVRHMIKDHSDR